ncbi:Mu transposase C-terminal domain-containing protein [Paracoccus sp. p3-h83]|uniref:Mu transposase C-terminal domain-containing protein n=1 Tax=Paracoccus sp. p3-h83 TaxID=3342805 RepID=UPI0035B76922
MNQLTLPLPQDFFTAAELAEVARSRGLAGFPATERSVRRHAEREGWNEMSTRVARPRPSANGGRPAMEYHRSILPEVMQSALAGAVAKAQLVQRVTAEGEADRRKLAALKTTQLSARSRAVMEARAEILMSIDGYAAAQSRSRTWAIARFIEAQDAARSRQEIQAHVDAGEILTDREAAQLAQPLVLLAGFHLSAERLAVANDRRAAARISDRTLWRWFSARDDHGVLALAPVAPKEEEAIPPVFADFLRFYAIPTKPTVTDAHAEWLKSLSTPGLHRMPLTLSQVRYILKVRMNSIERAVGREGLLTLRSRMAYVTRTTEDMWPTTIYTADGKTFDAEIADPVTKRAIRPEITTVADVVTRKIVGISLARSENQRSVAEALRNACTAHGIPAIFYVDRGPGYRNQAMDADVGGLMGRLGITKMHAAPYGSQAKGLIERINGTVWNTLAKRLPTFIGADMDKEAGDKVHKLTRRELKEVGESHILPSWENFVRLCEAMVAEYNDRPHSSLPAFRDPDTGRMRTMTPNECWAVHVAAGFEAVEVDADEADDLFRPYEIRTARRAQVLWGGNQYFDEALERYHEEKVMVGYDYHQADRVWVREFDAETAQPGKLICVARFGANAERYVSVSYEQKAIETRAKGRLRRVEDKRVAIEAERDGLLQIEQQRLEPADFIDITPNVPVPEPVMLAFDNSAPAAAAPPPRRRTFASDEELAAWAMEHPDKLIPTQVAALQRCLSWPTSRENLRANGIDTEALRTLLRAAAANPETSGMRRA